jgi:hypothetical protein
VPTTGFFEAAFLFDRNLPAAFVADRATLAAASQIAGTLAAGLLVHRNVPGSAPSFWAFALVTVGGLVGFAGYPWARDPAYFLGIIIQFGNCIDRAAFFHRKRKMVGMTFQLTGQLPESGYNHMQICHSLRLSFGMGRDFLGSGSGFLYHG